MDDRDYRLYIDGTWTGGSTGETFDVIDPATEEVAAAMPQASADDVERAIVAARRSFDGGVWSDRSPAERQAVLRTFVDGLRARKDEIVDTVITEVGTPRKLAAGLQVQTPTEHLADLVERAMITFPYTVPQPPTFGNGIGQGVVVRQPIGVVSAMVPYNYPYFVALSKIGPALAAGCSVVVRPSPYTPLSALIIVEEAERAGLPAGVLNLVTGDVDAAALLTTHRAVDLVSFTGSVPVGAEIMGQAARTIKRVVMELGGKNADIICDDADLARAVPFASYGAIRNTGQGCGCITRVLAHERVHDAVVERLVASMASYKIGDPQDPDTDIGPLISEQQRAKVEQYVQIARDEGATLVHGGARPEGLDRGYYVEPAVFTDVKTSMRIAQEEVFGPILVVIPFGDDDEAVSIANDSDYGLMGHVWSGDPARAYRIAEKVRAGQLTLNGGGGGTNPYSPLGGYKQSGIGREFGEHGLSEFLETKGISWGAGPG